MEPEAFLKQIDERIPGFMKDLQPLMQVTKQILAAPADTELRRAVQAQVAVATEHFGGMLAESANGFGLTRGSIGEKPFRPRQSEAYGWIVRIVRDPGVAEELTVEAFWRGFIRRGRDSIRHAVLGHGRAGSQPMWRWTI